MQNLPQDNPTGTYNCYINNIKVPSILMGNVLECLAPNSSQLPLANYQTGNSCYWVYFAANNTAAKHGSIYVVLTSPELKIKSRTFICMILNYIHSFIRQGSIFLLLNARPYCKSNKQQFWYFLFA